ncbi:hypothetical protein BN8_01354 [Fibrisoma limi BUZ 3]|uniref:Uncharacterized protein n=2 Tax=Fibrisoma limi TaxID=663275 RepID=I2GEN3_9BACT|nr:hypothetical protein BN8_01354 [Fibrisoma limi BUZ 3]
MANLSNAIEHLRLNHTPYWWLFSGTTKVGQYTKSDNLDDSIAHLQNSVGLLPDGNYRLKSSDKENNHSGAVQISFNTSANAPAQPATAMQTALSTNAYGVPDHVLKTIQEETRRTLLFEQMSQQFGPMAEMVKDLVKRVEKIEKYLADDDKDGIPNFLDTTKKVSDTVQAASEMKKVFSGGKLFG